VPGTLGIAVQPLTPDLAAALGTVSGVVVADVDAAGPASGVLRTADVVTALEGQPVTSADRFLLRLASRQAGETVAMTIVRGGQSLEVAPVLGVADSSAQASSELIGFQPSPGGTRVVAATRNGGYLGTGLRPGDVILRAGELASPSAAQVRRLLAEARPHTLLVFTIRRNGEQRVVAVPAPAPRDASN
jgi:S1-C subfamily serine protease